MGKDKPRKLTRCGGCYYWRPIADGNRASMKVCHYCIDTSVPRGIPARECYKHEGTPYRPEKHIFRRRSAAIYIRGDEYAEL